MPKLTIVEAVKVIPVSESKLRRDLKSGKCSFTTQKNGKKVIDTAELERVYGFLNATLNAKNGTGGQRDTEMLAIKDNQIADLRNQLEKTETLLQIATTEKTRLLDLLAAEKAEKLTLMPADDEKEKPTNWLRRLIGG